MPGGIQCWDASGKLIVDIGDYNTRYLGSVSATLLSGSTSMNISFSGASLNGSFAVITAAQSQSPNWPVASPGEYSSRAVDGSIYIYRVTSLDVPVTLTVDVYAFL